MHPLAYLRKTTRSAIERNNSVASFVPVLLSTRSPAAVVRPIATFIIDSIKSQFIVRTPHIGKEILKRSPPIAHSNAPAPVIGKLFMVRVATSLDHGMPSFVCFTGIAARIMTMLCKPLFSRFRSHIFSETTARFGITRRKIVARTNDLSAAITAAQISRWFGRCFFENDKPSESESDQGNWFRHGIGHFNVMLSNGSRPISALVAILFIQPLAQSI